MQIVLEGPDNSGKSTLANNLKWWLNRKIIPSEGVQKYEGEMDERVRRYFAIKDKVIFDRHPCISHKLYSIVGKNTPVSLDLVERFKEQGNLIIYCRPIEGKGMVGHVAKEHDTAEYVQAIEKKYTELFAAYDDWGLNNAHLVYRIGDDLRLFINLVKGAINEDSKN